MDKKIEELTFEEALKALKETVEKLESEDMPLEESLKLFEFGMQLSERCSQLLDEAELKIKQLMMDENGERKLEPFTGSLDSRS